VLVGAVVVGAAWADSDVLYGGPDDASPRSPTRPEVSHKSSSVRQRGPLAGALLIADRGNDRMLLVNPAHEVLWHFPNARDLRRGVHLNFNDDGFVAAGGHAIVANEEEAHTIVSINIATHRRIHLFGIPGVRGGGNRLLNTPDDAYPLPNGEVAVADAYNCRVIWIYAHRIVRQLGKTGVCVHDPPRTFGALNGDTPLRDGGMLISEIPGHWVDEIGPGGKLRWSVQAPVRYPSDPQMLPGGRILVADYSDPGQIVVINRFGRLLWRYGPPAGPGALDHPSLALPLPNGDIAVNDDYRDRVVVIDPRRERIVWQYGHTDIPSKRRGFLNTPDGLDFVPLDASGRPVWSAVHHPG
jgi:outer membrane protein assembly factor BamB